MALPAGPIAALMLTEGAKAGFGALEERHRAKQAESANALQAALQGLGGRGTGAAAPTGGGIAGLGADMLSDPFVRQQVQQALSGLFGGQQKQQQQILGANDLTKVLPALKQLGGIGGGQGLKQLGGIR